MKKILLRVVLVLVLLFVAGLVCVFLSLNSLVKNGVNTYGPQIMKVPVTLGGVDLSPFSGNGQLSQLVVGNPDGYQTKSAFELGSVKLGVELGSVLSDTIVVDEINIQNPVITFEGTTAGNNLTTILNNLSSTNAPAPKATSQPAPEKKSAKKFVVKSIVLQGARVNINISAMGKSVVTNVTIPDIQLQNVGTPGAGVSTEELVKQILTPVVSGAVKAATESLAGKEVDKLKQQAGDQLNKATKGAITNVPAIPGISNFLK